MGEILPRKGKKKFCKKNFIEDKNQFFQLGPHFKYLVILNLMIYKLQKLVNSKYKKKLGANLPWNTFKDYKILIEDF